MRLLISLVTLMLLLRGALIIQVFPLGAHVGIYITLAQLLLRLHNLDHFVLLLLVSLLYAIFEKL